MTPTVLVETEWWDIYDTEVVSEAEAATALLGLTPTASIIPEDTSVGKVHLLLLALIATLQLVVLLLTPTFLSPDAAYVLEKPERQAST